MWQGCQAVLQSCPVQFKVGRIRFALRMMESSHLVRFCKFCNRRFEGPNSRKLKWRHEKICKVRHVNHLTLVVRSGTAPSSSDSATEGPQQARDEVEGAAAASVTMPLVKPSAGPEPSTGTDLETLNNFVAESMDFASGSDDPSGLELDPLLIGDEDVEREWLQSLDFASWGETLPPLDLDTLPFLDDDVEREFLEGLNFALWDEGLPDLGPNVLVDLLGLDLPGEAIPADPPSPVAVDAAPMAPIPPLDIGSEEMVDLGSDLPIEVIQAGRADVASLISFAQAVVPVVSESRFRELIVGPGINLSSEVIGGVYDAFRVDPSPPDDDEPEPEEILWID